jgi:hypothetical protein
MFVQVIQGHVADREELKGALDHWANELAPGSIGWLGTTAGITADDMFIALARFESAEAARRNSDRPEQHQWWMETAKLFAGDVAFHDSQEVLTFLEGGSDRAGFVQVIQGRTDDPERMRTMLESSTAQLRQIRPDVIGGIVARYGEGEFTQAVYFTSETAARQGERQEEFQERSDEMAATVQDARFFDLSQPWLYSPR